MQVPRIDSEATMGAERGDVVVAVVAGGTEDEWRASLRSVLANTPDEVAVVVCGEGGLRGAGEGAGTPGDAARQAAGTRGDTAHGRDIGVAATLTAAITAATPADLALVRSPCVVPPGWLEGLREAAQADIDVATASALELKRPDGTDPDAAAAAVAAGSPRLRPRLPAPGASCAYLRRSALELVGGYDAGFAARCAARGLRHLLADDVLVAVPHPAALAPSPRRAVGAARRALDGLRVAIDARNLGGPLNGTRVHVLELIAALGRCGEARVTAIVPDDLDAASGRILEALPGVTVTSAPAAGAADVVHRPFQIAAPADLAYLARVADRLVVTHQDLISFSSPGYFADAGAWEGYRRLTRDALAVADRVLFFSDHVRRQAIAEDLVEPGRASVVRIGVDHAVTALTGLEPAPPPGAEDLTEFVLCLGTDFQHKNRLFALELAERLRDDHGWEGRLVLAGPTVRFGSSRLDEAALLARRPDLAAAVLTLEAVSEAEKAWLLGRAALVLYPSVEEGFGLVPFEAADHGVPCLWAAGSALRELLPTEAAGIVPWEAGASAERALALMRDDRERAAVLAAVGRAASTLTWDAAARGLLAAYRSACDGPPAPAGAHARAEGLMAAGLSEDAVRLVGPGGALPRDVERPLLALATRPRLAKPTFAALRAGYRAWRRLDGGG